MQSGLRTKPRQLSNSKEITSSPYSEWKEIKKKQWPWLRKFSLAKRAVFSRNSLLVLSSLSNECKVSNMRERVGIEQGAGRRELRGSLTVTGAAF
jgi:hypothetical protein